MTPVGADLVVNSPPWRMINFLTSEAPLTNVNTHTSEEIVMVGHIEHICLQLGELKALDIVDYCDEGHTGGQVVSVVTEVEVIDPEDVGVLAVH